MVLAIFDELSKGQACLSPTNHFTIGIDDDVTHTSLDYDKKFNIEPEHVLRSIFYGLGADGTVGANKNTIKIIGEETDNFVQAYFVYDAKKSGSKTVSHLRFSPKPIHSAYLVESANFIGCHQYSFINKFNVLEKAAPNSIFLLNSIYSQKEIWQHLPRVLQEEIITKNIDFYVIDAYKVAAAAKVGAHINIIMQTCFFALSNILPKDIAIKKIKSALQKTYASKGEAVVNKNFAAVDIALENLHRVEIPKTSTSELELTAPISADAPKFVKEVIGKMVADRGDELPVSAIPVDGSYPTETTCFEKRNVSFMAPDWNSEACIQCGQCSLVCPHSVLRVKHYKDSFLEKAPAGFKSAKVKDKKFPGENFTILPYLEDCTGCGLCVEACPIKLEGGAKKAINLTPKPDDLKAEREKITFFESLPESGRELLNTETVRDIQYLPPFFEFCGACAGCGEAPYVRILSQLYGERLLIADACGCSLVYGNNLPTTPWSKNTAGHGPAFSGSLFEDNAEFGLGFALTRDKHREYALELLDSLAKDGFIDAELINNNDQRGLIKYLKQKLGSSSDIRAKQLLSLTDYLLPLSVWAVGGDGWAYDIGYGGLDHVIASDRKINILVLDTEVYSNTGGQSSKATSRGQSAKFATSGKNTAKKDLGLMAMSYGSVYVGSIALGANQAQALKVFHEAESFPGPSLIIAYSPCIAHGIDMRSGLKQQKLAVQSGYWLLYRYDPRRSEQGLNPLQLDSGAPSIPLKDYLENENRFRTLLEKNSSRANDLLKLAEQDVTRRFEKYKKMAE